MSLGVTDPDSYPYIPDEELDVEWIDFLKDNEGNRRKIILFYVSISALVQNRDTAVKKLENVFRLFKENKDKVVLYYAPDPAINIYLSDKYPDLYKDYQGLVSGFIDEDYGIYDEGNNDIFMVRLCDAFYGDNGNLMYRFMRAKKPVMAINYAM